MLKYILKRLVRIFFRLFYCFPIINNRIIFISYGGKQYSCNPKYIYEYLYQKYGDRFQYIWVLKKNITPKYAEVCLLVKPWSIRYYICLLTSKVIISNLEMLSYIPLRKKQIFINTWHGGGAYKCVDNISGKTNDAFECLQKIVAKQTSWFISSSVKFIEITSKGKGVPPEKFLKCGMPRNDIFFNDYSEIGRNIRSKYNILPNQSILLYAPTYRGKTNSAFFKNHLNFENCIQAMNKKFYTEVVIFLRAHHALLNNIDLFPITSTAINVSEYSDMQELLCTADFLITDYSSCMWDFSLTKKPGFLFVPDLEQYEKDRSFYTTINTWPYPFAKTNNELVSLIEDYDRKYAEEKINTHLNSLGSFERGNASDIVGETIFREIEI